MKIARKELTMDMKKITAAAIVAAASAFGFAGVADAATGVVNVNAVLAATPSFQKAGKEVANTQKDLQNQFNDKAKNLDDKGKQALAQDLSQQLAKKEADLMKPIQEKLRAAVEKAAKAKNVDTVVVAGGLMYGKIDVDLTEDVKAAMK